MKNVYRRAIPSALACAILVGSYFVLNSVIASTSERAPKRLMPQGANGTHAVTASELGRRPYADQKGMYAQTLSRIKSARGSRDLNELKRLGDEIELNWHNLDVSSYASLMLEVCNALSSTDLHDNDQYVLEQKYASLVLNKQLQIPAEVEAQLMLHLQEDLEYAKGQLSAREWQEKRSGKAELWLRTWGRLNAAIDPNFDFKDLPMENVPPPPGVAGVAGMAPDRIRDPELRARYQNEIDANNKKAEDFRTQSALHKMRDIFGERMKAYLVRAYSRPPDGTRELEAMLKRYFVDESLSTNILSAVKVESGEPRP